MTELTVDTAPADDEERRGVRFERLYDFTPAELWSRSPIPPARPVARAGAGRPGRGRPGSSSRSTRARPRRRMLAWDEPRVLEYEWRFTGEDESVLRFELQPQESAPCSCSTTAASAAPRARGTPPAGTRTSTRSPERSSSQAWQRALRGATSPSTRRRPTSSAGTGRDLAGARGALQRRPRRRRGSGGRHRAGRVRRGGARTSRPAARAARRRSRARRHALRRRLHPAPPRVLLGRRRGRPAARRARSAPRTARRGVVRPGAPARNGGLCRSGRSRSDPARGRRRPERRRLGRAPPAADSRGERQRGARASSCASTGLRCPGEPRAPRGRPRRARRAAPTAPARCGSGRRAARPATRR